MAILVRADSIAAFLSSRSDLESTDCESRRLFTSLACAMVAAPRSSSKCDLSGQNLSGGDIFSGRAEPEHLKALRWIHHESASILVQRKGRPQIGSIQTAQLQPVCAQGFPDPKPFRERAARQRDGTRGCPERNPQPGSVATDGSTHGATGTIQRPVRIRRPPPSTVRGAVPGWALGPTKFRRRT